MSTTESAANRPDTARPEGAEGNAAATTDPTGAPDERRQGSGGRGRDDRRGEEPGLGAAAFTWLREVVIVVVLALGLSLIVKTWLLQAFYIPSESMENTLLKGDRVVVSKLTPGPFDLNRGDVVVFADPNHWLADPVPVQRSAVGQVSHDVLTFVGLLPNDEGNHLIKRVIGLPGDHVVCCTRAGLISVNGTAISEEYIKPGDAPSELKFNIRVPAGRVWVMGDNRSDSGDSRYHDDGSGRAGSVPESLIVGRAMTVVWPLHDVAWLGRGGSTFAEVREPAAVTAAAKRAAARQAAAHAAAARKASAKAAAAKKAAATRAHRSSSTASKSS